MIKYQQVKATLTATLGHEPSPEEWAAALELTIDQLEADFHASDLAQRKTIEANLDSPVNPRFSAEASVSGAGVARQPMSLIRISPSRVWHTGISRQRIATEARSHRNTLGDSSQSMSA